MTNRNRHLSLYVPDDASGDAIAPADGAAFDVYGPLPSGVTLLEASAGTGKTFTIAALVARYVAEGTELDRLLVVTFTRMATGEFRDRVRSRLVSTAIGLPHDGGSRAFGRNWSEFSQPARPSKWPSGTSD